MFSRLHRALIILAIAAAAVGFGTLPSEATDHDKIRHAVERGEICPLTDILAAVRDKLPGEVTGIEVEQKNGRWLYEFRVVDGKGRLFEVYVDARTAEIERIKEK